MLSIPQIYRIGTMFLDDKYGTQGLSSDVSKAPSFICLVVSRKWVWLRKIKNVLQVIGKMRTLMAEDSISMPNNTFLLDVDSRYDKY